MTLYLPNQTLINPENRGDFPNLASRAEFAFLNGVDHVLTHLRVSSRLFYIGKEKEGALAVLIDDIQRGVEVTLNENSLYVAGNNLVYGGESPCYTLPLPESIDQKRVVRSTHLLKRADDSSYKVALYVLSRLPDAPVVDVSKLLEQQAQHVLDTIPYREGSRTGEVLSFYTSKRDK